MVVQLVRVGEQTGHLEPVLTRAADALEGRRRMRFSVLTALTYPAIVLVSAIGVTAFMVLNVIPKLEKFLSAIGRKLPAMTQLLLDISRTVDACIVPVLAGAVVLAVAAGRTLPVAARTDAHRPLAAARAAAGDPLSLGGNGLVRQRTGRPAAKRHHPAGGPADGRTPAAQPSTGRPGGRRPRRDYARRDPGGSLEQRRAGSCPCSPGW